LVVYILLTYELKLVNILLEGKTELFKVLEYQVAGQRYQHDVQEHM
jgi:hypothetical protein